MQKDSLWTRAAWMWQLSWHLLSLGAAAEPERTLKSPGLTQEQGCEPLYQSAAGASLHSWLIESGHGINQTAQCRKAHLSQRQGWQHCPSWHGYALAAFRDKLPAELIIATALTTTTPKQCSNRTNNLKDLPVNTGATSEINNFLI